MGLVSTAFVARGGLPFMVPLELLFFIVVKSKKLKNLFGMSCEDLARICLVKILQGYQVNCWGHL